MSIPALASRSGVPHTCVACSWMDASRYACTVPMHVAPRDACTVPISRATKPASMVR